MDIYKTMRTQKNTIKHTVIVVGFKKTNNQSILFKAKKNLI